MFEEYYSRNSSIVWYQTAPKNQLFFLLKHNWYHKLPPPKKIPRNFPIHLQKTFSNKFKNLPTKKKCFPKSAHLDFFFWKKEKALEQLQEATGLRVGRFEGLLCEALFVWDDFVWWMESGVSFLDSIFWLGTQICFEFSDFFGKSIASFKALVQQIDLSSKKNPCSKGGPCNFFHGQTS